MREALASAYPGTPDLVDAIVSDSKGLPMWRPVRAATIRAVAQVDAASDMVWMFQEEFVDWMESMRVQARRAAGEAVGIPRGRRRGIIERGERITPPEALAIAHYRAGLKLPAGLEALDPDAFEAWFTPRFGSVMHIHKAISMSRNRLTDAMRGYTIEKGHRIPRTPNVQAIRALDWVWRIGPYSPYGERPHVPLFPGQEDKLP